MPDGSPWPRISIVTPNYNQGHFLEETLRSVLLQGYPNLEYIVIDGGSTDESVEIIRKYEPWLAYWATEPDEGQSDAINKGFARASGDLYNWVNGDDLLLPGALRAVSEMFVAAPGADWVTGARITREVEGGVREVQVHWASHWPEYLLDFPDFPQEATFFSATVWKAVGGLRRDLHNVMDVLFLHQMLRFSKRGVLSYAPLSCMNVHGEQKTHAHRDRLSREYSRVLRDDLLRGFSRRIFFRLLRTRFHRLTWDLWRLVSYPLAARHFRRGRFDRDRRRWTVDAF